MKYCLISIFFFCIVHTVSARDGSRYLHGADTQITGCRHLIIAPANPYHGRILALPDTSFKKLIDSCSIMFTIKRSTDNRLVQRMYFTPEDRLQMVSVPGVFFNGEYTFYFQIFWVGSSVLKDPDGRRGLNYEEETAYSRLSQMMTGLYTDYETVDNGMLYTEEFKSINCSITSRPEGAVVYLIPRYEWDFKLRMPQSFSERDVNAALISKLQKYKMHKNTQLDNYGLPEITYVIIIEQNNRYGFIGSFTPSAHNPQNNIVEKNF